MRVLHIIPSYFPAVKFGGPINSVHILNRFLVKKGIDVVVFTTNAGIEKNINLPVNIIQNIDGVKVVYLPSYFYEHYNFSPQLLFNSIFKIKDYDLVHITAIWNFPVLAGALGSIINKKPYILSPRGVLYEDAINIKSRYLKKIYYFLIARYYLNRATALHFTTEHERNGVASFIELNTNSFIVPNAIDLNDYRNLPEKGLFVSKYPILRGKRIILFLGRLNKQKGIDLLLKTFLELVKYNDSVFLVLAGPYDSSYGDKIKNWLEHNGLINKVLMTGLLQGSEKLSAYVDADVFVLPSYFENFGMAIIEAMACRKPVVISDRIGISHDVLKSKAGVVIENNPGKLFESITNLLGNSSYVSEISENGRKLVERNYNINETADIMINNYEMILRSFES